MRRFLLVLACIAALMPRVALAEPPWPDDLFAIHIIPAASGPNGEPGYWVWDPYRFAGGDGTPHFWTPRWIWVTASATASAR